MGIVIEVALLVLALWFGPAMIYRALTGRDLGTDVPVTSWARHVWPDVRHALAVTWWVVCRLAAWNVPRPFPSRRHCIIADLDPAIVASPEPDPASLDNDPIIPPGNRGALVEQLVADGWSVGQVRSVLKGDNGTIGIEVDTARQRLGLDAPKRQVSIAGGKGGYVEI